MAAEISVEALGRELRELLDRLPAGESVTVVGADGKPVAMLYTVKGRSEPAMSDEEWFAKWEELAKRISKAWKSDKSALEILSEMR
jgi:antitoxin (DNA-binding transcriptional repressor) of toxin-antitoxin stability system